MDLTKNSNYIAYHKNLAQETSQYNTLQNNYELLAKKYQEINSLRGQFQTLNSAYADESEIVTSNYYHYIVYLFVAILLICLLFRFSGEQTGGGSRSILDKNIIFKFLTILIILFLFFLYYKNT
jgi:hypothetical protein